MKEGKIVKWNKKVGDKVSSGEAIAEVETDKSNLDIEAYDDGTLVKIVVEARPDGAGGRSHRVHLRQGRQGFRCCCGSGSGCSEGGGSQGRRACSRREAHGGRGVRAAP